MADPRSFLLDTNILVALLRKNEFGQSVDKAYALSANLGRQLISVVTVGEMYSLARQFRWGESKTEQLEDLFKKVILVDINEEAILSAYGEIDSYLKMHGNPIGQNDVWIAATCSATGAVLLTSDRDFNALDGVFLQRIWINPRQMM